MTNAMRDLLQYNRLWLEQAQSLLESLTDEAYATSPAGLAPHRAGGHLRHILEFYEGFLAGLRRGYIDYDARRRDALIETSRAAAASRIQNLLVRFAEIEKLESDGRVWVKAEASESRGVLGNFLASSLGRELQMLSSHTVHHFALMAVTLRLHGVAVPETFGVAPSTLRYLATKEAAA